MMTSLQLAIIVIGCLTLFPDALFAQANVNPIDYQQAREQAERPAAGALADEIATVANEQITKAQVEYAVWSLANRRSVFQWQYWSTMIIFVCVVTLIACGLYFSYTQFTAAPTAATPTSIKVGKDGLEINSPVIGLLVLFLSLGFFYLYLTNVYPITEVGATPASAAQSTP